MSGEHYLPFEQAREFVHSLGFKKEREWWDFCSTGKKPPNIPFAPWRIYDGKWKDWGDWLGSTRIGSIRFLAFEKARDYARSLKLKSVVEWKMFCKSGRKPSNIPSNPMQTYKNEWLGWGDWLGTGKKRIIEFLPFEQARDYVRSFKFKTVLDWKKFCKSDKKPLNIPSSPQNVYWKEWKGWKNWLGTGRILEDMNTMRHSTLNTTTMENDLTLALDNAIAELRSKFLPFEKARSYVRSLGLKNTLEWRKFSKSGTRPFNIPSFPYKAYRKEWNGWNDWLGKERTKTSKFLTFEDARDYVRKLGLQSFNQWRSFCKSGKRPLNIPANPNLSYKDKWKDWGDWLGTGTIGYKRCKFLTFEDARDYVRKLELKSSKDWQVFCKSENKPSNIPSSPNNAYWKNWRGWRDWLFETEENVKNEVKK